jgi:Family of unknown function (DUF6339)
MSPLLIFKETFVHALRSSISANLKNYVHDDVWVDRFGTTSQREIPTLIEPVADLQFVMPIGNELKDTENAIQIHKALPNLTPLQARDPRLWVRLTHIEFWSYMRKRWPIERYLKDSEKKGEGRVLERYFVPQSQSRALIRNGVARLWWAAQLSFSPMRDNPYELTQVLLSTLDITQSILERSLGRAPNVVVGFLEFLRRHKDELLSGGDANRAKIRQLTKFLNLHGGVCILDYLEESQIIELLEVEYASISK